MSRHEEEAVVLDSEVVGEADRRVLLLGERGELIRGRAPSAARSRRRFGAALQPGSRVRVRWTVRAEGALAILDEAQLLAPPPSPDTLERYYTMSHLLETTIAFAREGADDPRLFRLLALALERLTGGAPPGPLARYFEAWTLRLAGLLPEFHACSQCGRALADQPVRVAGDRGVFCAQHAPPGAQTLSAGAARWLEDSRRRRPEDLPAPSEDDERELGRLLPALISEFTERPLRAWTALSRRRRGGGARETS